MHKVLLVIDYQVDFAAADGALSAGAGALQIESAICEKIVRYKEEKGSVFFTLDTHLQTEWDDHSHPEAKAFPPHCIKGTPGHQLFGQVDKLSSQGCKIEKRAYCPDFTSTPLSSAIKEAEEIEVCGLVTDICVFQTLIGLYTFCVNQKMQKKLLVDSNACASFNPEREQFALQYMKEIIGVTVL